MRVPSLPHRNLHNESGVVLPAALLVVSMVLVAVGAVGFVLTARPSVEPTPVAKVTPTPTPTPTHTVTPKPKPKPKPVKRGQVFVEVYNNSNIAGLAGRVAGEAQAAGWNVVGSDNWYGTISTSTVYYPERLKREATLLAKDLHIGRLKPAIEPMRFDRLTVILTGQ